MMLHSDHSTDLILSQAHISKRKLPVNFSKQDLKLFEHDLTKEIYASKLILLENVMASSQGVLFQKNKIVPESMISPHPPKSWKTAIIKFKIWVKAYLFKKQTSLNSSALWIIDNWSINYFHWMTDCLPKLFVLKEKEYLDNVTLLLPEKFQEFEYVTDSLKLFTIKNIRFINSQEIVQCQNMILATPTALTGNYNETIIRKLRNIYHDFYANPQNNTLINQGDKIYISRGKSNKRKIINEAEVIDILKQYNFQIIYFENLSFQQQILIAMNARYLVTNHGAGLCNMLFMKEGNNVLELRREGDCLSNCYFALASALGLNYFYQLCAAKTNYQNIHSSNLIVDILLLKKNLDLMLTY